MGEVLPGPRLCWVGLLLEEGIFFFLLSFMGWVSSARPQAQPPFRA